MPKQPTNTLQTLDRGLAALKIIAGQAEGITVAALAAELQVHRAIAYRLVATLEGHGLVARAGDGALFLGGGIQALATHFAPQFRRIAEPLMQRLASETQATAFISAAEGDECVVIMVVEPEHGVLRVSYRVGSRHPLNRGAAGIAILAGRPEAPDDSETVRQARRDGYCVTRGQLQRGAVGVASAINGPSQKTQGLELCLGVVAMDDLDEERAIACLRERVAELRRTVGIAS
jgi:DNA-binding IclR family transcriptional regulator